MARLPIAAVLLALGLAQYRLLFWRREWIDQVRIGLVAAALILAGTAVGVGAVLAAVLWAAAAPLLVWLAARRDGAGFAVHGVAIAFAATAVSGLLWLTVRALFLPASSAELVPSIPIAVIAISTMLLVIPAVEPRLQNRIAVSVAILAIALWNTMGIVATALIALLGTTRPAGIAVVRIAILAAAATAAELLGRQDRFRAARYLVSALLVLGGAMLLIEGFRVGSATTWFLSLAIYGIALVAIARLRQPKATTPIASAPDRAADAHGPV